MEIVTRKLVTGGVVVICAMVAVCCTAAEVDSVSQPKDTAEASRVLHDSMRKESDRRFADQDKRLVEARKLAEAKKYAEASKLFDALEKELREMNADVDFPMARSRFEDVQDERMAFRRDWAASLMAQADAAESERRFAEAMSFASDAQSICPDYAGAANDLITRCQAHMNADEKRKVTSLEQLDSDLANREAQIKQLLAEARVFYRNRKFDQARKCLEKVYILNPSQPEAIEMMSRIWREYFTYAIKRSDADAAGMLAYNAWSWSEPVFAATETVKQQSGVPEEAKKDGVYAKMERIVFPNFKLEASDVTEAIKMLSRRSQTLDPEREGVQVDIEYDINKVRLPKITLDFSGISMLDLLQIICEDAGLVMNAGTDGTISVSQDRNSDRSARFTIRGDFLSRLESEVGSGESDAAAADAQAVTDKADGADGAEESKAASVVGNSALSKYFIARGVPVGSKTKLSLLKNKLIITDASYECIRDIEEYLTKLDALEDLLVQVEIRTAEISEIDIQSLGFDWSLSNNTDSTDIMSKTTGNSAWSFSQPSKFLRDMPTTITGEVTNSAVVKDLNIFPALFGSTNPFGSDIPLNISLTINALCQNTRAETLSAPKITTKNNESGSITLTKTYFFPESWETYELEVEDGSLTITVPTPEFPDDGEEVGIKFTVKPTIMQDKRTIRLAINSDISSYVEGDNDNYPIMVQWDWVYPNVLTPIYDPQGQIIGHKPYREENEVSFNVWMPIIRRRKLDVTVDVYDGETLVLGGTVENNTLSQVDKWPILGDLPLIGRFFQSQGNNKNRSNLLIFVTARLVNNKGVPIPREDNETGRGTPDFRM